MLQLDVWVFVLSLIGVLIVGGLVLAILTAYVVSAGFLGLESNFIFNPATAVMLHIFPESGENFGEILGGICQALSAYAILPMVGGVIGFFLARYLIKKSLEKNPPVTEKQVRAMYEQGGRKLSEKQVRAIMHSINKNR